MNHLQSNKVQRAFAIVATLMALWGTCVSHSPAAELRGYTSSEVQGWTSPTGTFAVVAIPVPDTNAVDLSRLKLQQEGRVLANCIGVVPPDRFPLKMAGTTDQVRSNKQLSVGALRPSETVEERVGSTDVTFSGFITVGTARNCIIVGRRLVLDDPEGNASYISDSAKTYLLTSDGWQWTAKPEKPGALCGIHLPVQNQVSLLFLGNGPLPVKLDMFNGDRPMGPVDLGTVRLLPGKETLVVLEAGGSRTFDVPVGRYRLTIASESAEPVLLLIAERIFGAKKGDNIELSMLRREDSPKALITGIYHASMYGFTASAGNSGPVDAKIENNSKESKTPTLAILLVKSEPDISTRYLWKTKRESSCAADGITVKDTKVLPDGRRQQSVSGSIPIVMGEMVIDAPGSKNVKIEIDPTVGSTWYAGLIFETPCVLGILDDFTLVASKEGILGKDKEGRYWRTLRSHLKGGEVILFVPE